MPFHGFTGIPSPDVPDKMVEGTLLEWTVGENDYVKSGHLIGRVQIGPDVYVLRICFPAVILELYAPAGQTVTASVGRR